MLLNIQRLFVCADDLLERCLLVFVDLRHKQVHKHAHLTSDLWTWVVHKYTFARVFPR
ncbi:hypothetical protein HMPREF1584_01412, partial [Gardnerella vaginalis JCP8481A]